MKKCFVTFPSYAYFFIIYGNKIYINNAYGHSNPHKINYNVSGIKKIGKLFFILFHISASYFLSLIISVYFIILFVYCILFFCCSLKKKSFSRNKSSIVFKINFFPSKTKIVFLVSVFFSFL